MTTALIVNEYTTNMADNYILLTVPQTYTSIQIYYLLESD